MDDRDRFGDHEGPVRPAVLDVKGASAYLAAVQMFVCS
jgi:hypothetical protein